MACTQLHFDVPVFEFKSLPIDEPKSVTLTKTNAVHIINSDPCTGSLDICIKRIVKCQNGCQIDRYEHDFPIDGCDPILPPGEYEITIPSTTVVIDGSVMLSLDVIFEEVSDEYVRAIIANKLGC